MIWVNWGRLGEEIRVLAGKTANSEKKSRELGKNFLLKKILEKNFDRNYFHDSKIKKKLYIHYATCFYHPSANCLIPRAQLPFLALGIYAVVDGWSGARDCVVLFCFECGQSFGLKYLGLYKKITECLGDT